jgi:hypothetical protein
MSIGIGIRRREERVADSCSRHLSNARRSRILILAMNMFLVDKEPINLER